MSLQENFDHINNTIKCPLKNSQETQRVSDSRADFGYSKTEDILRDLYDEIDELKIELKTTDNQKLIKQELGDVIFTLCNLANRFGIDTAEAIEYSTKEFQRRIVYIENNIGKYGIDDIKTTPKDILDKLWREAKKKNANE